MHALNGEADHLDGLPIVAVAGPTAAGKTGLAVELARAMGGEIVNADALQMYRGMEIGTAKPGVSERGGVPHHLYEVWDVRESASLAQYQGLARAAVADIRSRDRIPLLVGGSWLYLRAVCDVLNIPPHDPEVRRRWAQAGQELGAPRLHDELARRDPEAARAIDPRNLRRIVRALEVVELTGSFTARMPDPAPWLPTVWLAVDRDPDELDRRIAERAAQMWACGLLDETRALVAQGLTADSTAGRAVGYAQALAVLSGERNRAEGLADTVRATTRLARRQRRMLRADPRVAWLHPPGQLEQAVALLADRGVSAAAGSTPSPGSS
jgi:tRNA dimethylallyltransferase